MYSNYLEDDLDKEYLCDLLTLLIKTLKEGKTEVLINSIKVPFPESTTRKFIFIIFEMISFLLMIFYLKAVNEYPNWIENKIPERRLDSKVLQLHEKQIIYFNKIRAEDFIEKLQELWETSSNNLIKLNDELEQDWLYFAIKMCYEKLPGKLPNIDESMIEFKAENSVEFALYQVSFILTEKIFN